MKNINNKINTEPTKPVFKPGPLTPKPLPTKKKINPLLDRRVKNYHKYVEKLAGKKNDIRRDKITTAFNSKINESVVAASIIGGAVIGSYLTKRFIDYKDRYITCNKLENPLMKNKCYYKVLKVYVNSLKNISNEKCENTPDPAQCKLDIIKKIDSIHKRMSSVQKKIIYLKSMKHKSKLDPINPNE